MSLISLKDKPATKDDIGKTVYWIYTSKTFVDIKQCELENIDDKYVYIKGKFLAPKDTPVLYWQEPTLIDKSDYEQMQADLKEATQVIRNLKSNLSTLCKLRKCPDEYSGYSCDTCKHSYLYDANQFLEKQRG